jgi:hypothetical protein
MAMETSVCMAIDPVRITRNMQLVAESGSRIGPKGDIQFQDVLKRLMWPEVPRPDDTPRVVFF